MSWLTAWGVATVVRAEYQAVRRQLAALRGVKPDPTGTRELCPRCGCDTRSCAEWSCLPQGEPMTRESLAGHNDAYLYQTHYERGGR